MTKPIRTPAQIRAKILSGVALVDDCWEWEGARTRNGYAFFNIDGHRALAHRASYKVFVGPIPDGLVIDHLCRNRACLNPAHMEPVTTRTNLLRGMSPMAVAVRTGMCKRGHDRTPPGAVTNQGHCRRCFNQTRQERRRLREAADPALREARLQKVAEYSRARRRAARSAAV